MPLRYSADQPFAHCRLGLNHSVPCCHAISSIIAIATSVCCWPEQVRDWLCPVNRRWPLAVLLGALACDYPRGATTSRHFVLIEYVMLCGVNDTVEDAHR